MSVVDWLWLTLKYGLVGLSGLAVDFGVTWLLKENLKLNPYVASGGGFIVAATSNYTLNRLFTYYSTNAVGQEFFLFITVAVAGLLLNLLLLWVFHQKLKLSFYLAKAVAIAAVFLWNFLLNTFVTFA